ncbi:MAG: Gfo/Idh/MocA family protein [Planctomycetota bacterium]|jgi:predicted dehydrogenase
MKYREKNSTKGEKNISRRNFLTASAAGIAAFTIVPRYTLGGQGYTPPSEKLDIACIGVSGRGRGNVAAVSGENIVAMCDVDEKHAADSFDKYPKAKKYHDFRKMLEKQKNIDAVVVATPDHTHAVAAMMAIKMGKHVYCEKPLTHSVYEARRLTEAARRHNVATQMGVQLHATEALRLLVEMLQTGAIGKVHEVHLWSNKPQNRMMGANRPKKTPMVPTTLDWGLWLGPAPYRPYHPNYVPYLWRAWWDFGCGRLGDMGCHIIDPAFWALKLKYPKTIEGHSTPFNSETFPIASVVRYEFDARGDMPPVTVHWYSGGIYPWRPPELEQERNFPKEGGLYIGEKGKILAPHGAGPKLIPESKMKGFKPPEPFLPRGLNHHQEWLGACKGGPKPLANFDYAGPLTEVILLGNVAIRTGKKLTWDGPNMQVTNIPEANQFLSRQYRQGWTL